MFTKLSETLQKVTAGFGVHDLIAVFGKEHHVPINITGYGPIMSMGALIIQSGDSRRMPANSRMLLHPLSLHAEGDIIRLGHEVKEVELLSEMYTQIISARAQKAEKDLSPEKVEELMEANMGNGTYLTPEEALKLGLIDEVI